MTWCTGDPTYDTLLTVALAYAAFAAVASVFIPSPYGRFASARFGLNLSPRLGWFLMELPAVPVFCWFFFTGPRWSEAVPLLFLCVWLLHYANRGFLFPYLIRVAPGATTSFSLLVVVAGWGATALHGYLNASWLSTYGAHLTTAWLTDPRFLAGLALYLVSYGLTLQGESIQRNLRTSAELAAGQRVYRIPRGGLYRWVTSPCYLTELTGWAGFALATWSPGGLFIFAISCANLVPRAFATQRWYRQRFPDYPPERKALIPFLL
ncbi:MAG TPA: 3-oxo-5-alpha-steroid 4-dehydrogenase [Myxococcota bacterium]|nr:3-oxo-5-alpha-steroid 4-dehydrogenase [Myxococcota bacterium]HRY94568.1 3-oxo-5-alpha-steroid 4-dehydrogenase [Myxococcota bacterium]HSA20166.1 3-oxo-5-alpha-steroid 4-dehydrogenase [Myxococcota bacterium]